MQEISILKNPKIVNKNQVKKSPPFPKTYDYKTLINILVSHKKSRQLGGRNDFQIEEDFEMLGILPILVCFGDPTSTITISTN